MKILKMKMPSKISVIFYRISIVICLLSTQYIRCHCFKFDQKYIGVSFRPYVKESGNADFDPEFITYESIKTMLTVVSGKFSKIFVRDNYSLEDEYIHNITYHEASFASLYSGEVAAKINRENGRKVLSVIYEAFVLDEIFTTNAEIELVFEAAMKANQIFPNTVDGVILASATVNDASIMQPVLHNLKSYKPRASKLHLKLGADIQTCFALLKNDSGSSVNLQKNIIALSDIISCNIIRPKYPAEGPVSSFKSIAEDMLAFKEVITGINPNVSVIGNLEWSSSGIMKWETIDNQRVFWESASEWAGREKYTVYLEEAFDNPWRDDPPSDAHLGWWKLKNGSDINTVESYVEKCSGYSIKAGKVTNRDTAAASSSKQIGALFILLCCSLFHTFYIIP